MMLILVGGAHSDTGKTTTVRLLQEIFPESYAVKLGCGKPDPANPMPLLHAQTSVDALVAHVPVDTKTLIVESNRLMDGCAPDLTIFMDDPDGEIKEGAKTYKDRSDLISSSKIPCSKAWEIADHLQLSKPQMGRLLNHLKIKVTQCQLGLF